MLHNPESKEHPADRLSSLKEKLITIWNKVQPPPENNSYDQVFCLDHPSLQGQFNPYRLFQKEHESLVTILSILIRVTDEIKPSFANLPLPKDWVPLENRHRATPFTTKIVTNSQTTSLTVDLHVELIQPNFAGERRAVSLMNGLLTLFTQGFDNVEKAGPAAVKSFCILLISSDDTCIDARTRMAINFALSGNLGTHRFSEILNEAYQACGEDPNYFALIAYVIKNHWEKSFKEDTGKNAICSVAEHKASHGRLNLACYPLIKKGITQVLQENKVPSDFMHHHDKLAPKEKFEFFRVVLKESQCIKSLAAKKSSEEKQTWKNDFENLLLTRNPENGKNILGFAAEDCKADDETLSILIDNLSNAAFKQAILQAGIIWHGETQKKIVARLTQLDHTQLASYIEISTSQTPWDIFKKYENLSLHNDIDAVFINTQYYSRFLRDSDVPEIAINKLKKYIPGPELLEIVYYSGIIKNYIELPPLEYSEKIKPLLNLFSEDNTRQKNIFDALMNTYSELRGSNLFSLLIINGIDPKNLLKNMSQQGIERAFQKAALRWSSNHLDTILSAVDPKTKKRMLFAVPVMDILIHDRDLRNYFTNNLAIIAKHLVLEDVLSLLAHRNILALATDSADLFDFFIKEIIRHVRIPAGHLLCFLYNNHYFPVIQNKDDIVNIEKVKKLIPIFTAFTAFSCHSEGEKYEEEKRVYAKILSTPVGIGNTNLLGFINTLHELITYEYASFIYEIPSHLLLECINNANVYWRAYPLQAILEKLNDLEFKNITDASCENQNHDFMLGALKQDDLKNFLLNKKQLIKNGEDVQYFLSNLDIVTIHISYKNLLEIFSKNVTELQSLLHREDNFDEAVKILEQRYSFMQVLELLKYSITEAEIIPDNKKIKNGLFNLIAKVASETLNETEKKTYSEILAFPGKNNNLIVFFESCCRGITLCPKIITSMRPEDMFKCVNQVDFCWGYKALETILNVLGHNGIKKNFLLHRNQLFNDKNDFLYFQQNLRVISKELGEENLLDIVIAHKEKFAIFIAKPINSAYFNLIVQEFKSLKNLMLLVPTLPAEMKDEMKSEIKTEIDPRKKPLKKYLKSQLKQLNKDSVKYHSLFSIQTRLASENKNINHILTEVRRAVHEHEDKGFVGLVKFNYFRNPSSFDQFKKIFDENNQLKPKK